MQSHQNTIDLGDPQAQLAVSKSIMRLLDLWDLSQEQQCNVLGLSSNSRSLLSKFANGTKALPKGRDASDRIGYLLSIHKSLRLLYPNQDILYQWIKLRNKAFNNDTPLKLILDQGIIGLAKVCRYLDMVRGR